ncbi:MAG: ATP-binding protein [Desulfobacteraceae bacterium]
MRELALHIMDIIENGLAAGASLIQLSVFEDRNENWLRITIKDNGRGIPADKLQEVMSPFYTTRTTRRVGLGLSLFREASKRCDGEFNIRSKEEAGTEVFASFRLDHIDLAPIGDMAGSLTSLIMGNPDVDFVYTHEVDGKVFRLDTREVKGELEDVPINHPEVIRYLASSIRESLTGMKTGGDHL